MKRHRTVPVESRQAVKRVTRELCPKGRTLNSESELAEVVSIPIYPTGVYTYKEAAKITGGYAMTPQINEAQWQANIRMTGQNCQQQIVILLADRSFGHKLAGIQASHEERDLQITQGNRTLSLSSIERVIWPITESAMFVPATYEATKTLPIDQMSQIVSTLSLDWARLTEMAMTLQN
ncbi:MAG: hypothetical protein ABI977_31265 [Acidobacteriota bacterium]